MAVIKVANKTNKLFNSFSLADASESVRENDVLLLKGSVSVSNAQKNEPKSAIVLDKSCTIEGTEKSKLFLCDDIFNFKITSTSVITFKNIELVIAKNCNIFKVMDNVFADIIFDNVKIVLDKSLDSRDVLPFFAYSESDSGASLTLVDSFIDFSFINVVHLEIVNSIIGNFFKRTSILMADSIVAKNSTFSNSDVKTGKLIASDLKTFGYLILKCTSGEINGLVVSDVFFDGNIQSTTDSKFEKMFDDISMVKSNWFAVSFENAGTKDSLFSLSDVSFEKTNDLVGKMDYAFFSIINSSVLFKSFHIPYNEYLNRARFSIVSFNSIEDESPWTVEECKLSGLYSTSKIFGVTDTGEAKKLEGSMAKLNKLIGLTEVKEELLVLINNVKLDAIREKQSGVKIEKGSEFSRHLVLGGSAGTGKTTVAMLFAEILYENGVIRTPKCVVADREKFISEHVGGTAIKTKALIESAFGGVLFIDEAYSLRKTGGSVDYASEMIDTLIPIMENNRDDLIVILAGYTEPMLDFIKNSNEGFSSRMSNWINFPDYTFKELYQILLLQIKNQNGLLTAKQKKETLFQSFRRIFIFAKDNNPDLVSGNARFARNYSQQLMLARDARLGTSVDLDNATINQLSWITDDDILKIENDFYKKRI